MEIERCSECGANLALVGRTHRCLPGAAQALADARGREKSDGGVESRHAPKTDGQKQVGGTKASGLLRQVDSSVGRAGSSHGSGQGFESSSNQAGVAPSPSDTKPKFDRNEHHRKYMREYMRKRRQKEKRE